FVVLEDNGPLSSALQDKRLPETLFRTVSAEHHDLHLKLSLPQGYEANLHPLLLMVDGEPGQVVTEEFSLEWPQVLSGSHGVALAWVGVRSGGGRGQKSPNMDPRKLGSIRVKDYLSVVESVTHYTHSLTLSQKSSALRLWRSFEKTNETSASP
ncbi:dipeptidyl aminopeptidase-like protein 6, partial [Notothenia coriiceps]|uniref:Dipeptidyl aminopeptidase-like protein 6 n=1 Tax=Notothenia coriiceps TaxID=8208 RepID=A0A6I9PHR8_9TELE